MTAKTGIEHGFDNLFKIKDKMWLAVPEALSLPDL